MIDLSNYERTERNRSVSFDFRIGTIPAGSGYDRERELYAVLNVSHHKAGVNYFNGEYTTEDYISVSLNNETVERGPVFTGRGFGLFKGLGLTRLPAGKRFSRKRLNEAADEALLLLAALVEEGNEKVLSRFEVERYNAEERSTYETKAVAV